VGDLDVLASSLEPDRVVDRFVSMPPILRVLSRGSTKSTVVLERNIQVDLRVIKPDEYGAALQYFTGSTEHNVKLRTISVKKGYKLNEYGLFERETDRKIAGEDEGEIYRTLGMEPMPPELRENRGEIEAAISGSLPSLVEYGDIKGDLHVHTRWSDGSASIEEMAQAAMEHGWEYIAICDHSKSLGIARGLDEEQLRDQIREIDKINRKLDGFTLLKGSECDIKRDGSLDLPDRVLGDLDFVVASIHSSFKASREKQSQRLVTAMHNEYISTIGHPTGRLLQKRPGYELDLEKVFEAAREQGVMMEICAYPDRLDLNDLNTRAANEHEVTLSLGTDSHAPSHFDFMEMGVSVARRGWLTRKDVINTLSLKQLQASLGR
jgi:DNA polymerase (family 10)